MQCGELLRKGLSVVNFQLLGARMARGRGFCGGGHAGVATRVGEEGVHSRRFGHVIIECKLRDREPIHPVVLGVIDEGSEILLEGLVGPFRLPVRLGVVRGGQPLFNAEGGAELPPKIADELRSPVRSHVRRETVPGEEIPHKLSRGSPRGHACDRDEVAFFGEPVNDGQDVLVVPVMGLRK